MDLKPIEAEARKKDITTDKLLEQKANAKVADPTDAEVYASISDRETNRTRPMTCGPRMKDSLSRRSLTSPPGFLCAIAQGVASCRAAYVSFYSGGLFLRHGR